MILRNIKNWIMSLAIVFSVGGSVLSIAAPITVSAASSCEQSFLGFPAWYKGLLVSETPDENGNCNIQTPATSGGMSTFVWHIVLNVIEMAMMLAGYVAVGFILYGGFQYLTSQGDSKIIAAAKGTITNAVIGLVISIVAVLIVNLIVGIM